MALPPRKPNKPDTTAPFKSAMAATVRAVAGKPDLEVSFSADRPLLTSDKARLANLPRLPTRRDIAVARGQGDAMAMRLASHDPDIHRRRSPAEPEARAAFDALEQARVEALGCLRMPGMTGNIHEMLDDRLFRSNLAEVSNKDDAPLAEALGLIIREKLAGVAIPPSGHAIVDLWKKEIEQKAGLSLTAMLGKFEDQELFARAARHLLRDLNLVPEGELDDADGDQDEEAGDDQESEQGEDTDKSPEQGEGESEDSEAQEDQAPGDSDEQGETEGADQDFQETDDDAPGEAGDEAPLPPPGHNAKEFSNQFNYKIFTQKFDEIVKASELCPPEELDQLWAYVRSRAR